MTESLIECRLPITNLVFPPGAWRFIFLVDSSDVGGELSLLSAAVSFPKKICASPLWQCPPSDAAPPHAPPAVPPQNPPSQSRRSRHQTIPTSSSRVDLKLGKNQSYGSRRHRRESRDPHTCRWAASETPWCLAAGAPSLYPRIPQLPNDPRPRQEDSRFCIQFRSAAIRRKANFPIHGSDGNADYDPRLASPTTDGRLLCPVPMAHHPPLPPTYLPTVLNFWRTARAGIGK